MIEEIKNIWIYDIEVFCKDWVVVFQSVDNPEDVRVFHNDRTAIDEFLLIQKPILCGFNNKHYDDYIMLSIIGNGTPEQVKAHNDFIIGGEQGFLFPGIKGMFKDNYFQSFDLKDDLPLDLSLKAIEGNMGKSIVESEVDFTIDHALTDTELEETIYYCKQDVANTLELFHRRKAYLDGKLKVAKVGNLPAVKALGLTNPKLSATFLKAKPLDNPHEGETVYNPPDCLKLDRYKEALEFYKTVDYEKSLSLKVKDLTLEFGWGGIHGAVPNSIFKSGIDFKIVDIDVGSYYPSMILRLGYYPSAIPSAKGYEDVYNTRLKAKHEGDSDTADALKLVLKELGSSIKNSLNVYQRCA